LEPVNAPLDALRKSVLNGSYNKPYIIDNGETRSLHFDLLFVQSSMDLDDPIRLRLRYTQWMMGFLLLQPTPKQITLIGLGGGSLAKYCHHHLPTTDLTVVEIDPYVVALREHFMVPADDHRFRVVVDDGMDHLASSPKEIDVVLVDAYDGGGIAHSIAGQAFLSYAYQRLGPKGIFVMNLTGGLDRYEPFIALVKQRFDDHVANVPVGADGNHILYAFKAPRFLPDWKALRQQAKKRQKSSFTKYLSFAQALEHAWSTNEGLTLG
jgi:spermidine synthase